MKSILSLLLLIAINSVHSQNLKTFSIFSVSSLTNENSSFEVDADQTELVNTAFLNALNKSGSIALNLSVDSRKEQFTLFEVCQILDNKADSNDFAIYNIIGGWRSSLHDEFDLINEANINVSASYILNFLSMNKAKNQLLVFLMPKGYSIPAKSVSQVSLNLAPGTNIIFIQQTSQSKFISLVDDYISAIEEISNETKFDINKDNIINVSEFFFQLENFLKDEKIYFEIVNLTQGPDLNLMEVK